MIPTRYFALWLLLISGCATVPEPKPTVPALPKTAAPSTQASIPVQLASAELPPTGRPTANSSFIGKATLEDARALLSEARNELEPRQWELLDSKLTDAEQAFERFNKVARESGRVAQVAKGAESGAEAGRTGEATEGIGSATRLGPLLALLILLWPAETARPEYDHGPDWLLPEQEFKAKLREVSKAAQQVRSELMAARRAPPVEAARRNRPPKPNEVYIRDENWTPAPGESEDPPCEHYGSGGDGPFRGGGPGWVRCTYACGKYVVTLNDVWGNSTDDCNRWPHLVRAKKEAENWARVHDRHDKGQ